MYERKIIDIRRSFIPINANEFPETLHATGREDWPEDRVPVIPYKGHNFLPTSYGYRSYFGLNFKLDTDSLLPNRPDAIFLFQTLAYKNIIVALCDTGIWVKDAGELDGIWTQIIAKVVPDINIFFEWYYATIRNKLYLFRTNDTNFYEIETDITDPLGIVVNTLSPTFITLNAQLGMFRLGSRIGFWDGTNAVAISSADDLTDITPNILTGANVTTFNSVIGKISAIRSHGQHAIIYASKSVVFLQLQAGDTFLVKASPILQDTGVPYSRQSVVAIPDSLHFAYTSTGIYKIEEAKPELIVPEVYDYFKRFTISPVYLKILQGRYLCFECIDPRAIDGDPQFSEADIPESVVVFPAIPPSLDEIHNSDPTVIDTCAVANALSDGLLTEQKNQANTDIGPDLKTGTNAQPIYTAYLSRNGIIDLSNLTWGSVPCGWLGANGEHMDMSPNVPPSLAKMTTDKTNKIAVDGRDAWIDGKWTIARFVQTQMAIWGMEEKAMNAFMTALKARVFFTTKSTEGLVVCVPVAPANSFCELGEYVTKYSDPQLGYNPCSFWLTRYAEETEIVRAKKISETSCSPPITHFTKWRVDRGDGVITNNIDSAEEAATIPYNYWLTTPSGMPGSGTFRTPYELVPAGLATDGSPLGYSLTTHQTSTTDSIGTLVVLPMTIVRDQLASDFTQTVIISAINEKESDRSGVLGVETAFCEITGWLYTDKNGKQQYIASSSCQITNDSSPGAATNAARIVPHGENRGLPLDANGNFCGNPFEIPTIGFDDVKWPDQVVTFPAVSYLLQLGSIAPMYPTLVGSFVYDLHLKKWGKIKLNYKLLVEMLPINSESTVPVQKDNFGILAGCYLSDGQIYLFDEKPADSRLTWGKIGYYRLGMTDIKEIQIMFARNGQGYIETECSIDGINLKPILTEQFAFKGPNAVAYPKYSAKWYNISVVGIYDVVELMTDVSRKGRR